MSEMETQVVKPKIADRLFLLAKARQNFRELVDNDFSKPSDVAEFAVRLSLATATVPLVGLEVLALISSDMILDTFKKK